MTPANEPFLSGPVDAWTRYERIFTVPNNFVGDLRLVFVLSDDEFVPFVRYKNRLYGEAFIDDVALEEVAN